MEKFNNDFVDFVNVSVRIRPLLDENSQPCVRVISKTPSVLLHIDRQQTYHFDNIFSNDSDQENVFCCAVKPLISKVKEGFNCTVFAYGQTGTGKTYTMGTNPQTARGRNAGFIPRTLHEFFSDDDDNSDMDIFVSFIEIYNEKVYDLLNNDDKNPLQVNGFKVQGTKQERIYNFHEGMHFLEIGGKNRHTGETKQNANSSRSHAIFTIHSSIRYSDGSATTSKLNLVDLAGSESVKKTGNRGSTFHEGININKGLLCIGQVMTALSHNALYIPYRQSIITSILKDSLDKKNYISLIACVSSNPEDSNETAQTLEFSQRVKKMKNKPEINLILSQYKLDNPSLFERQVSNVVVTTGLTPFKRNNSNVFQTPFPPKKLKNAPSMSSIQEASRRSSAILDSPKSLFSMSLSSISNADVVQQTLSPMLKKYMTAMENSLMDKLQSVIENTVKKMPTKLQRSDEENTSPSFSWHTVQKEVSKLVRSEMLQLTGKAARATSSPLEDIAFTKTRRVLNYDQADIEENEDLFFKTPNLLQKRKGAEDIDTTAKRRRSSRLQKKLSDTTNNTSRKSYVHDSPNQNEGDNIPLTYCDEGENHFKISNPPASKRQFVQSTDDTVKRRRSSRLQNRIRVTSTCNTSRNMSPDEKDMFNKSLKKKQSELVIDKDKSYEHFEETILGLQKSVISSETDQVISEVEFKVPKALPPRKTKRKSVMSPLKRRSSIRLQQKEILDYFTSENSIQENEISEDSAKRRTSMRIQSKRKCLADISSNQLNTETVRRSRRLSMRNIQKEEEKYVDKCVCNSLVSSGSEVKGDKKKRAKQNKQIEKCQQENLDSPITVRMKQVLNILNRGDRRDIEKLHSVGPKTADRILMFRQIKGTFKKIADLSDMPEWQDKRYKRFLAENFLRDDSE